jgi:PST family polysaccharide transporter
MNNYKGTAFIQDIKIEDLRQRSLQSGTITFSNQALRFFLQTVSTMIMARLLTPWDFGLVAMVSSLLGFVTMFSDFGLSIATIQKQSISHEELSGLFWVNLLSGLIIMTAFYICAPFVAKFYNEPRTQNITLAFGGMAILSSMGAQHSALLQRQMRFGAIAACDLSALLVGVIFGIIAALYGLQFWALVIMQAANTASSTILLWWMSGWRPGPPRRTAGFNRLLKFGGSLTLSNFLGYANHNLDKILLGKFFGETDVGFYSKAQGILNRPLVQLLPPIMRVATPMFSRLVDNQNKFRKASIELAEIASFGGSLLLTVLFPTADWIVYLLLGDQWAKTIPVFRLMAIFGLLEPLAWLLGTILVAFGKPEAMAKWRAVTMVVVLISFIAGLPWGIIGIAIGYTLSGIATRIWLIFFVGRRIGISGLQFIWACAPFVLVGCGVSIFMMFFRSVWEPQSALIGFISFFCFGSTLYVAMLACIPNNRRFLKNLYKMGRDVLYGFMG